MSDLIKILYVDDEKGNIDYFRSVFRREYDIFTAGSGDEALMILREVPDIWVILTDQRMPKMTGVEFLRKAIEITREPVRILVTGYTDMETVINAINLGHIYYYISKPWTYDEMKIIISRAVETYQLRHANKELLLTSERIEKERIVSELAALRNQVNPHFLFNCLNTLHALVAENSEARDFVRTLSGVYRYLLDHTSENMVLLRDELEFANNYLKLQLVRFQGALDLINEIDSKNLDRSIPSATLQLLLENAIKHNVVTRSQQLTIRMQTEGDQLVVTNNYQPKRGYVESTGIGLDNLRRRLSFVTDRTPQFEVKDGYYVAKIPLL